MKKRSLSIFALALAGVSTFMVGCGGSDNGGGGNTQALTVNADFDAASRALPGFADSARVTLHVPSGVTYSGPTQLVITRSSANAGPGNAVTFNVPPADGYTVDIEALSGGSVVGTATGVAVTRNSDGSFAALTVSTVSSSITGVTGSVTATAGGAAVTLSAQGVNASNQPVTLGSSAVFEFGQPTPSSLGTVSQTSFTPGSAGTGTIPVTLRGLATPITGTMDVTVNPPVQTSGKAIVKVSWAAREAARSVPAYAESIVIQLKKNGSVVPNGTILESRQTASAAYDKTYDFSAVNFDTGSYTVDVKAYSGPINSITGQPTGTLVGQAVGIALTVPTDPASPVVIDTNLTSTVASYKLFYSVTNGAQNQEVPNSGTLANLIQSNVGAVVSLNAQALNGAGEILFATNDQIKFEPVSAADTNPNGAGVIWLDNTNQRFTVNRAGDAEFKIRMTGTPAAPGQAADRVIKVSIIGRTVVAFTIPAVLNGGNIGWPAGIGLARINELGVVGTTQILASGNTFAGGPSSGFLFTDPSYAEPNYSDPAVLATLGASVFARYSTATNSTGRLCLDEPSLNVDGKKLAFIVKPIITDATMAGVNPSDIVGTTRQARNRGDLIVVDLNFDVNGNLTGIGSRQPQTIKEDLFDERFPTWDKNGKLYASRMPVNQISDFGGGGAVGWLHQPISQAVLTVSGNAGDGITNGERKIYVRNDITALPDGGNNVTVPQPGNHFWPAISPNALQMAYTEGSSGFSNFAPNAPLEILTNTDPTVGITDFFATFGFFQGGLDTGNAATGRLAVFTFAGPVRITSSFVTDVFETERVCWGTAGERILVNRLSSPNDINKVLNDNALGTVSVEKNGGRGGWLYLLVDSNNVNAGTQEALVYRAVPSNEIRIKFVATGPANDGFVVTPIAGVNPVFSIPAR